MNRLLQKMFVFFSKDQQIVTNATALPPNWVRKESRSKNTSYYFNTKTNESRWEKPLAEDKGKVMETTQQRKSDGGRQIMNSKKKDITRMSLTSRKSQK